MNLNELIENPNNPSYATDEDIQRLVKKLQNVPDGLKAMRIAYVTDEVEGKKMVISGNKRLRVLKKLHGEDADVPDDWFQDVTSMSKEERHNFIVQANISDGTWDVDLLLQQYELDELKEMMNPNMLLEIIGDDLPKKEHEDDEDDEEESTPTDGSSIFDKTYRLGSCSIYCGDQVECDRIRQLYCEDKYGADCDWKTLTPMIG